jgi:hypothetical protein
MKSEVRKTMVVATAFTGAAACAAAFMPSAALATTQQAARPDLKVNSGCADGTSDWLHMAETSPVEQSLCWGWTVNSTWGYMGDTGFHQIAYCGGNNFGWFSGVNSHGTLSTVHFHNGTTYGKAGNFRVWVIHISRYSGNDGCNRYFY